MKTEQDAQSSQLSSCIFCPEQQNSQPSNLFTMMNHALISKHISQSNSHLIQPIDVLLKLQDANTTAELQQYIMYKQYIYVDNMEENLKRQYKAVQFQGKISMLSQYYKFHKDIPHIVERNIEKILSKYYDRRRQFDYKIIKKKLKEEQGLSITSVEETITENSQTIEQKSRYSTLLNALGDEEAEKKNGEIEQILLSDSNLLQQICRQIGRALPKTKISQNDFKGSFYQNNNERNFEKYVKKQKLKRIQKQIRQIKIQQKLKRKTKNIDMYDSKQNQKQKISNNYLNFQKKFSNFQNLQIKNSHQNHNSNETLRYNRNSNKYKKHDKQENKKKFVYNTNIKIQIQNAMFYPNQHHHPQFSSAITGLAAGIGTKNLNIYDNNIRSRKSLVGKINNINQDRYRTPVSKIYQPHDTEISTRYGKKNRSIKKQKERLKTKESRQFKDNHYQRQREISVPRRVMSSHIFKRVAFQPFKQGAIQFGNSKPIQNLKQKNVRNGTISVAKLKLEHQKNDLRNRGSSVKRGGSSQNLRRRSITLTQNKNSLQKGIPITKYSSSEIKETKFKGISMKQLLSKKLNVQER